MQPKRTLGQDKFPVEVALTIFKQSADKMRVGLISKEGKNFFPKMFLDAGKSSYEVADFLINEYIDMDRTKDFNIILSACLDGEDLSDSGGEQKVQLIFRIDISSDIKTRGISFFESEDFADMISSESIYGEDLDIFYMSVARGVARV